MERWPQDWYKALGIMSEEIEQFFLDATTGIMEVAQIFAELSEVVIEQTHDAIAVELEHLVDQFDDWIDPSIEMFADLDTWGEEPVDFMGYPVVPNANRNPACIGCRHYHGYVYGGNLLVCGMHPYGWESENCPDWESR